MRSFGARAEIAKQLFAAASGVLAGENPVRRLRKALRLLSVPPDTGRGADKDVLDAGFRALRLPSLAEATGPVCLFVAYAPDGRFFAHTLRYCADLKRNGLRLVLIAVTDRPDLDCLDPGPEVADALVVRENHGYDFAAWAACLRYMPELWAAPELWFANDSVYHAAAPLAEMVERVRRSPADVVAMTGSSEIAPHFQSYLFVLKDGALRREGVRRFWGGVRSLADKNQVIRDYEVRQKATLEAEGLKVEILFSAPGGDGDNRLHHGWRALLAAGFPFVKVQLLRDNPYGADLAGWRDALAAHEFDIPEITFHLGARPDGAAALLELR
ncbi:rhamnan synthesis F family protein [Aquabacter sp. CN5-332]|uniref:rhamnan synthesis F family protein n=1 Tax=Aquabacter sp. CN5-332 TaxID=3156608 RepID=UPI0032B35FCD